MDLPIQLQHTHDITYNFVTMYIQCKICKLHIRTMARIWYHEETLIESDIVRCIGLRNAETGEPGEPLGIPYVPPSSCCFQMGIWSPKQHLFDWEFCVGLPQTLCKQWTKGFCKILKFWPLHSVRQNVAGFRRGLFTCFLGHTSLLPAFWATPHYNSCGPKSR